MRPLIVVLWVIRAAAAAGVLWAVWLIVTHAREQGYMYELEVFAGVTYGFSFFLLALGAHGLLHVLRTRTLRGMRVALWCAVGLGILAALMSLMTHEWWLWAVAGLAFAATAVLAWSSVRQTGGK